jgi:hypothetical protein
MCQEEKAAKIAQRLTNLARPASLLHAMIQFVYKMGPYQDRMAFIQLRFS